MMMDIPYEKRKELSIAADKKSDERFQLYTKIRDSYNELYKFEANNRIENSEMRAQLNEAYNTFVEKYGNLNSRANAKVILMDSSGRDVLSLERAEDGAFVKADIFNRPVAFSQNEITSVETPIEALSASLNKYGNVNLEYMATLTGNDESIIIEDLKGRIYFNPIVDNYEIADRFIAGNVVDKAEQIEAYLGNNPDDSRATESLQALYDATPRPIPFEELDFNFGERWIPTGIYATYASHLFDTKVDIAYSESMDEYSVKCGIKNAKIYDQFAVKGYYRTYDGISLLKHALVNTVPDISKSMGQDDNGRDIKVRDSEAIQLANAKIDEIRNGFTDWLGEQSEQFQNRLTDMYNSKFNCFVRPQYDGSHQTFPDIDLKALEKRFGVKDIYASQKDAIW
ncbi:MAG: DNA methylase, partial [Rikenellaceae bacterium]